MPESRPISQVSMQSLAPFSEMAGKTETRDLVGLADH